jgi:hypothetical protein
MSRPPRSPRSADRDPHAPAGSLSYRRLIVELASGAPDPATLAVAAAFARLLDLELLGLFVEDEALLTMADLPFAREIRLPTHHWDPIDPVRLQQELRQHAALMRQRLRQAVRAHGIADVFEVMRGDPAACLAERSGAGDIVAFAAPAGDGPLISARLRRGRDVVCQVDAAVLLIPPALRRTHGPVAVVLASSGDRSLETAADIAAAAGERLLVLSASGTDAMREVLPRVAAHGLAADKVTLRALPGLQPDDVAAGLAGERERLIVMTRGAEPAAEIDAANSLALQHRVPVLLVGPLLASEG